MIGVKYCEQNLTRIAQGSSRIVYKIDEQKVLKLAKNEKGIAQNVNESNYLIQSTFGDVVTKMYRVDSDDKWIIMEYAKKITPTRFKELTGVSLKEVELWLKYSMAKHQGKIYRDFAFNDNVKQLIKKYEDMEFMQNLFSFSVEFNMEWGDFLRISSYGEVIRNGKPTIVLTDFGFTTATYQNHYA